MTNKKSERDILVDALYFGAFISIMGICLVGMFKVAIILIVFGLLQIILSGVLIANKIKREAEDRK